MSQGLLGPDIATARVPALTAPTSPSPFFKKTQNEGKSKNIKYLQQGRNYID